MESTLQKLGFNLEAEQPHISGERFLMAKNKQVLVGHDKEHHKVIIKISNNPDGIADINNEKRARDILKGVAFANDNIVIPEEIYYGEADKYVIWAIEYIPQDKVFVAHSIEEQFFLILRAFEEQESFHATTYEHLGEVKKVFPVLYAQEYFKEFERVMKLISDKLHDTEINQTLANALTLLKAHKPLIDKYCNYLTHTDFVPHNFRVDKKRIYMLDCSPEYRTMHFGNKYEGWARFLNYMVIHNPTLNKYLLDYIKKNRGEEELESLRLMRIYKLGFLLSFYAESLEKTEGDLKTLTLERIDFWHEILKFILNNQDVPETFVEDYKKKRDTLRSEEEKKRQREFAVA